MIEQLNFIDLPETRGLKSRARSRAAFAREVAIRVNRAVSALKQLWDGELTDELIQKEDASWEGGPMNEKGARVMQNLKVRISGVCEEKPLDAPVGAAAVQRQQGAGSLSAGHHKPTTKQPNRGDIWPGNVDAIALPSGDFPLIPIRQVSTRAAKFLDHFFVEMLRSTMNDSRF